MGHQYQSKPWSLPFQIPSPYGMAYHSWYASSQDCPRCCSPFSSLYFRGNPHPYDKMKRQVIPAALRILRLKPGRNYCIIGDLAHSVGWRHKELLEKLEDKRKLRSQAFYEKTKAKAKVKQEALKQATADGSLTKVQAVLSASGY